MCRVRRCLAAALDNRARFQIQRIVGRTVQWCFGIKRIKLQEVGSSVSPFHAAGTEVSDELI